MDIKELKIWQRRKKIFEQVFERKGGKRYRYWEIHE